jgi:hypothetical protein
MRLTGLDEKKLAARIKAGAIEAITLNGEIAVNASDAKRTMPKEELPEYKRFDHLKGKKIWESEAERKYGVSQRNFTNWVKASIIRTYGLDGNKVMLDEQDVAYCVFVYSQNKGQGRRIFNADGTPFTSKRQLIR